MTRTAMNPAARKDEFLKAAGELFNEKGFEATSVEDIVQRVGVAKGLFYYYFESKDTLLETQIDAFLSASRESIVEVSNRDALSAMEKIEALFEASGAIRAHSKSLIAYFHKPQNRYLHLDLERRMLEEIVPAMEGIIRQGVREGIFHTDHPKETAIAYMAAASALGHRSMDDATDESIVEFVVTFQDITERLFGAKPGTFDMYKRYLKEKFMDISHAAPSEMTRGGRR